MWVYIHTHKTAIQPLRKVQGDEQNQGMVDGRQAKKTRKLAYPEVEWLDQRPLLLLQQVRLPSPFNELRDYFLNSCTMSENPTKQFGCCATAGAKGEVALLRRWPSVCLTVVGAACTLVTGVCQGKWVNGHSPRSRPWLPYRPTRAPKRT